MTVPSRHWRSYGTGTPLPTPQEALQQPLAAFPSWFLRITCDRCGKDRMVNESHARWRDRTLRQILGRMRHDGCGGLAGKAELLTGIEGASSRSVRRIVLMGDPLSRKSAVIRGPGKAFLDPLAVRLISGSRRLCWLSRRAHRSQGRSDHGPIGPS